MKPRDVIPCKDLKKRLPESFDSEMGFLNWIWLGPRSLSSFKRRGFFLPMFDHKEKILTWSIIVDEHGVQVLVCQEGAI